MTGYLYVVSAASLLAADTPSEQLPSDELLQTWHRLRLAVLHSIWAASQIAQAGRPTQAPDASEPMMEVPNEPGLSPNNGLDNALLSDQSMASNPRKGQAKRSGAKTTSHDGKAGHDACVSLRATRRLATASAHAKTRTPTTGTTPWPAKLPSQSNVK
ncbi:TPA: hypothetical protein ACH3X2_001367 [Trebouxia sp. C0005]